MSQTYAHYSTPSSLPSDYALLSRYAAHNDMHGVNGGDRHDENDLPETEEEAISDIDDSPERHRNGLSIPTRAVGRRKSFPTSYIPSFKPTVGPLPNRSGYRSGPPGPDDASENTPLLAPLVPRIEEEVDREDPADAESSSSMLKEEIKILAKYTLPVFGCVHCFACIFIMLIVLRRTHVLEYSLVIASVVSIGHLSTTALAASTLGSMTASVTGFSIIQGFASTLDTMLPGAWTSSQPQLVGLWAQRMGTFLRPRCVPVARLGSHMVSCGHGCGARGTSHLHTSNSLHTHHRNLNSYMAAHHPYMD